jgi:hypothetical protein
VTGVVVFGTGFGCYTHVRALRGAGFDAVTIATRPTPAPRWYAPRSLQASTCCARSRSRGMPTSRVHSSRSGRDAEHRGRSRDDPPPPGPDPATNASGVADMLVLDALRRSARDGRAEAVSPPG